MDGDREREELAQAGHTGVRGTVLFGLVLAVAGALFGSVVIAILVNMAAPAAERASSLIGAAVGAALGVALALLKVRQGNLDARESVEDREWRRLVHRQHGNQHGK
ncbi:MAG: hypothetical protein AB7S70_14720 [Hyphomicrobium sp.]|uniref:hypothetical protein n=1 Tax=Hyphomicrobium sp. TaxID=82 RepID=UPI003D133FF2